MKEIQKNLKQKRMKQQRKVEDLQRNKKEQGITLIALVVTIVVLLILAGITINMLFSNGGIFKTAGDAANAWNEATINEQESLDNIADQIGNLVNGQVGGGTEEDENIDQETGWDLNKVTKVPSKDDPSINVPVPKGFTPSTVDEENTVEGGFVIKQEGTNNEFVWIPVNSTQLATMYTEAQATPLSASEGVDATTDVYSNLRKADGSGEPEGGNPGSKTYREPDILTHTTVGDASMSDYPYNAIEEMKSVFKFEDSAGNICDQFADMIVADYTQSYESIKKYGGFYIGRYELTGDVTNPTVAKSETVINGEKWYILYKACGDVVNSASAKSIMINGTQWDRVLEWLVETGMPSEDIYKDSSIWGNYSNYNTANGYTEETTGYEATAGKSKQPAGSSEYWKANNIYDLAGNYMEWTLEANDTCYRTIRGGAYNGDGNICPASYRSDNRICDGFSNNSSRPIMYIVL